jgi:hypothetical protein
LYIAKTAAKHEMRKKRSCHLKTLQKHRKKHRHPDRELNTKRTLQPRVGGIFVNVVGGSAVLLVNAGW